MQWPGHGQWPVGRRHCQVRGNRLHAIQVLLMSAALMLASFAFSCCTDFVTIMCVAFMLCAVKRSADVVLAPDALRDHNSENVSNQYELATDGGRVPPTRTLPALGAYTPPHWAYSVPQTARLLLPVAEANEAPPPFFGFSVRSGCTFFLV